MQRYTRSSRGYTASGGAGKRLQPILLVLAVLAIAFLIFRFTGVGGLSESAYLQQRNQKLRGEAAQAVSCVNSLSRLGSTTSSATLGRVRQYVHGMETLNDLNVGLYGEVGRLFQKSEFDAIYSLIEDYETRIVSGGKVTETLADLQTAVMALSEKTTRLLEEGN